MKNNSKDFEGTRLNTRSNVDMKKIVRKGIELFLKEDESNAIRYLRENGVSNRIIARVLYEPDRVRNGDIIYRKHFRINRF